MIKNALAAALSAKLAATAAVAAAATGGIALAAATGVLPTQANSGNDHPGPAPAASHSTAHPSGVDASESESNEPKGTPSPNLKGLCNAFQAGATDNKGKAIDSPAFQALVKAAGGTDKLTGYCTDLIGAPGTHPSESESDEPSDHPTGKPSDLPSGSEEHGKPSATPSNTDHPTGKPTAVPTHR